MQRAECVEKARETRRVEEEDKGRIQECQLAKKDLERPTYIPKSMMSGGKREEEETKRGGNDGVGMSRFKRQAKQKHPSSRK